MFQQFLKFRPGVVPQGRHGRECRGARAALELASAGVVHALNIARGVGYPCVRFLMVSTSRGWVKSCLVPASLAPAKPIESNRACSPFFCQPGSQLNSRWMDFFDDAAGFLFFFFSQATKISYLHTGAYPSASS
jgi:hypothetical protein